MTKGKQSPALPRIRRAVRLDHLDGLLETHSPISQVGRSATLLRVLSQSGNGQGGVGQVALYW